jgi:hypothetical protein
MAVRGVPNGRGDEGAVVQHEALLHGKQARGVVAALERAVLGVADMRVTLPWASWVWRSDGSQLSPAVQVSVRATAAAGASCPSGRPCSGSPS